MQFVAIDLLIQLPPEMLPPDVQTSIDELNSTFMAEVWTFFALAVPIVVAAILLKSWIRSF